MTETQSTNLLRIRIIGATVILVLMTGTAMIAAGLTGSAPWLAMLAQVVAVFSIIPMWNPRITKKQVIAACVETFILCLAILMGVRMAESMNPVWMVIIIMLFNIFAGNYPEDTDPDQPLYIAALTVFTVLTTAIFAGIYDTAAIYWYVIVIFLLKWCIVYQDNLAGWFATDSNSEEPSEQESQSND